MNLHIHEETRHHQQMVERLAQKRHTGRSRAQSLSNLIVDRLMKRRSLSELKSLSGISYLKLQISKLRKNRTVRPVHPRNCTVHTIYGNNR